MSKLWYKRKYFQNIQSIFKPSIWSKEGEINDTDCCCNWIQENIKSEVRQNFGIGYNERILFIRDTSFWNSRNQGLALTDAGVYCIPDNDKMDEKSASHGVQCNVWNTRIWCCTFGGIVTTMMTTVPSTFLTS